MREPAARSKALSITLAALFILMSASSGLQVAERGELEEVASPMNTHSGLNLPGSTVGSIYSHTALGASYNYTCVVTDNNQVRCWGTGYLGNSAGPWAPEHTPVGVNQRDSTECCLSEATEISPDGEHTCALTNGSVKCWGVDTNGPIGHNHISCGGACNQPHGPAVVSASMVTIVTGFHHTCGIADDSTLYCWGDNEYGQLGTGDDLRRVAPTQILLPSGRTPVSVNAGGNATCVILDNGSGMCWGQNIHGHLGDGAYNNRNSPTLISVLPENRSLVAMDIGFGHTCGILDDGLVYCWGDNTHGRFGDGSETSSTYPRATSLPVGRTAISIDVGIGHTCAVLDDSSALCWGRNDFGQLGDGTTNNSSTPVVVSMPAGLGVGEISAGSYHSCAIANNASVYCWGAHEEGSLGLGEGVDSNVPAYVDLGNGSHAHMTERDNDGDGIPYLFDPFPDGCPIGWYSENGTCLETGPGWYADHDGTPPWERLPCNLGTFQPGWGQSDCIAAYPGYYVNETASVTQIPCEYGTYQPGTGTTSCIQASPGNFSSEEGSTQQTPCYTGFFQPDHGATGCLPADPGHFVSSQGAHNQTPCLAGTYQIISGMTSCFDANSGYQVPNEGSTGQEPCEEGTFSSESGQANCTEATPGHYVDGTMMTQQSPCQPGEYQPDSGQTSCSTVEAGHFTDLEGTAEQIPCEPGTFQPETGQTSCIPAEPGSFVSIPGATTQGSCTAGTFSSEAGQSECTPAEPGSFASLDGATGQEPCPSGEFQANEGSVGCDEVPAGQVVSPDGSSTTACPPGKYQPGGETICMDASPGHFVSESGSSEQTPCQLGAYQSESGQTDCVPASPGSNVPSEGASSQTPCSQGSYQSEEGQTSCTDAMPGHHVPEPGAISQTSCNVGTYQPDSGSAGCLDSSPGNFVGNTGSPSQTPCQPGSFQSQSGQSWCKSADTGHFVQEAGSTEQTRCPSGEEQELSGQSECVKIERPLWMVILMYAIPAVVGGTMAVLYISNKKKGAGGSKERSYLYSEDVRGKS
ncbi:MAG TPA: hypothetical protein QF641_03120 [Candidatus Thalassarchaeaceae archaeon]|nr:hypothetical protein [Candidatus Thalassarchaeaceae archaeon]